MSDTAIKFENISKQYRLGNIGTGTLSHDLNRWWKVNILGKEDPYLKIGQVNDRAAASTGDFVWALRDINFEVKQGEVLGIIGKNGAGKSTLLKILSRVTIPTTGKITAYGRIASLLEVGTGFHPEMTGRENIYMNGAIMGMTKAEITRKFDEIVDFSGVEKYIDTPVKRYSSGMTVRLGFAIAAHLEPEILVVDEVLAVGDAEFQKKAIGKMQDVSIGEGRTVLFVSHNMQSISSLTTRCLVMENGMATCDGKTDDAINFYLRNNSGSTRYISNKTEDTPHIEEIEVLTSHNGGVHNVGEELRIKFRVFTNKPIESAAISYQIINSKGIAVTHILNLTEENAFCHVAGEFVLISTMSKSHLYPDNYSLTIHFADRKSKEKFETINEQCAFEVKKLGEMREYYWYPNHATYIEDNYWKVSKIK